LGEARVVYSDNSGRRIRRRVKRRRQPAGSKPDEAKTRYIRQVAEQYPRFTPEEVHAVIYYNLGRHDISKDMVRKVLAKPRPKRSLWPFGR
jgi:deoxyadenosine/deoxycytidine kinase